MEKHVYISIPMTGREDTIWSRLLKAQQNIIKLKGYEKSHFILPIGINEYNPDVTEHAITSEDHTWGWYVGQNMVHLIDDGCTDIYMCDGWEQSKGCTIEHAVAKILNINIIYA